MTKNRPEISTVPSYNLNNSNPVLNLKQSQVKVGLFVTAGMRKEDERNGGGRTTEQTLEYYNQMKAYVIQRKKWHSTISGQSGVYSLPISSQ